MYTINLPRKLWKIRKIKFQLAFMQVIINSRYFNLNDFWKFLTFNVNVFSLRCMEVYTYNLSVERAMSMCLVG